MKVRGSTKEQSSKLWLLGSYNGQTLRWLWCSWWEITENRLLERLCYTCPTTKKKERSEWECFILPSGIYLFMTFSFVLTRRKVAKLHWKSLFFLLKTVAKSFPLLFIIHCQMKDFVSRKHCTFEDFLHWTTKNQLSLLELLAHYNQISKPN